MPPIIEIQHLGKQYKLAKAQPYVALRDVISSSVKNVFRPGGKQKEVFDALHDINLNVEQGERVGIIGRNGAGKSTLLKIISRITPPTSGQAFVRGRVGSLLEVGTGFHPELTGRENIYLNGSILGLKKAEIDRQFDAIVEFSGVERFIETPLKHYSSGMQLRLAFSVAAHLDPEILLIDEVLAVGDIEFQKKCIGKMEEVSKSQGRTILFVSHNMDSIRQFCPRSVLLDGGRIVSEGTTEKVISEYVTKHLQTKAETNWPQGVLSYDQGVRLDSVRLHDSHNKTSSRFDTTETIGVTVEYDVLKNDLYFTHGFNLFNQENALVFSSHDVMSPLRIEKREKGKYTATAFIPGNLLPEGIFSLSIALFLPNPFDVFIHEHYCVSFEVFTDFGKLSARGNFAADFPGIIRPLIPWTSTQLNGAR